ncbi:MAG: hypothetical protein JXQ29_06895, partial [Planctomycetes bacterium]|nr:hypothetical protein [Planctomycetota bacterium]
WLALALGAAAQLEPIGTLGSYPDIQLDRAGNLHLVYARSGRTYYRMLPSGMNTFLAEEDTRVGASSDHQKQPDVALDSRGGVHVLGSSTYNTRTAQGWGTPLATGVGRDHHMTVAANDDVWIVYRGNQLSARRKRAASATFDATVSIFSGGGTDHVYPDICAGTDGTVHVVFRMMYPTNYDCGYLRYDGQAWASVEWACLLGRSKMEEAPHVALDRNNIPWVAMPEGSLRVNHRTGGTWQHEIAVIGTAHSRSEPTIGVDQADNKFVGQWGGQYQVYNAATRTWFSGKLPSTNGDPIGFVDVVGDRLGAFLVYEQGKSVNKDVGAGAVNLVVVKVLPDGSVVPPGYAVSPSLGVNVAQLSARAGGLLVFALDAGPAHAGKGYVLLGAMSGTTPGLRLGSSVTLPLNPDLLTLFLLQWSALEPRLCRFLWWLDGQGRAYAGWLVHPRELALLTGIRVGFAFVTIPQFDFASNAVCVQIEP